MTYQSNTSGSISVASREMVAKIHRYVRWIFPLSSLDGGGSLYGVRGVKLIGSKKLIGGTSSVQESWAISLWCLMRSSIHSKISILNFYSTFNRLYIYIHHTVRILTMRLADLVLSLVSKRLHLFLKTNIVVHYGNKNVKKITSSCLLDKPSC